MLLDLQHEDLTTLIQGSQPNYQLMDELTALGLGQWQGGFAERWNWTSADTYPKGGETAWTKLSETELWYWYSRIRDSWPK